MKNKNTDGRYTGKTIIKKVCKSVSQSVKFYAHASAISDLKYNMAL